MMFFHKTKIELSPRLKFGVGRGYTNNQKLKIATLIFLVLAFVLSLNALRLIFSGPVPKNSATEEASPQVLGATDEKNSANLNEIHFIEYKVIKGDTLFNISQKFNVNWTTLATLNNLKSPFSLKPGQILKIPK